MKYRILRKSSTPFDKVHEECGVFGIFMDDLKAICQQGKQFSDVRFQLTVFSDIL